MEERPLVYTEFSPGEHASNIALTYWGFHVRALPSPDFLHRVWPDGCMSLTLVTKNGRGVASHILGVRKTPIDVPVIVGARYWGIRFRPESGAAWFGISPTELRERGVLGHELLGDRVKELTEHLAQVEDCDQVRELLDPFITSRSMRDGAIDTVVRSAAAGIVATDGLRPMLNIARDVGVSARVLQRRFAASVGISPKQFAILRRGRSALKRVVTEGVGANVGGWTGVALSSGFADQAHFTREVMRLTRFAPTALRARLDRIEHGDLVD